PCLQALLSQGDDRTLPVTRTGVARVSGRERHEPRGDPVEMQEFELPRIQVPTEEGAPMRVLIMSDMEGVSGIVDWNQVDGGAPMYEGGRRLYTEEINAAVRGARAAGATEIVAVDCHGAGGGWNFNSLIPELLDPGCEWVAHHSWTGFTELLEHGCDAALYVG